MPPKLIQITLIADNEVMPGLIAEHGFAAWIETGDTALLFDTGQEQALEHNARALGLHLDQADALILSHGHYDHTGGLPTFLAANHKAPVIFGKGATAHRLSCHPDQPPRAIGMKPAVLDALAALPPARRIEISAPYLLQPGIGISGPVPRSVPFEDTGGPFFFDEQKQQPDPIIDDLSMWFETTDGLVILTGCCHAGLINTVGHIRAVSGIDRVRGIIGGLHLNQASDARIAATTRFLAECKLDFLIPCHCTGAHVAEHLQQTFGANIVKPGHAGQTIQAGNLRN
ncbi:MBL fold metallo-hydrolase [Propionivibrio limicola]|uniref:MBL fold metallo-hydrolase n=1 Tax=Propionivibrio limicola TaxID=167645 RepID=UPI001292628D|nr:MBL fold metallo-hydrolase [Propionivibrio limicola]